MENFIETIREWIVTVGVKILIALLIFFVSFKLVSLITKKLGKALENNKHLDKTLTRSLLHIANIALKVIVVICLIGYLGIDTSGLTALVASLGVCVGLAVNGTLSNLAGGVMILLTRPFKIGDYILAQGYEGTVEDIHIVDTKLITVDNKVVHIPNGTLSTGNIVNYSEKPTRRVDHEFVITGNDPAKVEELIRDVCNRDTRILADPPLFVRTTEYGSGNGTKVTVRAWVKTGDYWPVATDLNDNVRKSFERNGIVIPYGQLNVHIKND